MTDYANLRFTVFDNGVTSLRIDIGPAWFVVDQYGRWYARGNSGEADISPEGLAFAERARLASTLMREGEGNLPALARAHFGRHRFGTTRSPLRRALLEFYADKLNRHFFKKEPGHG